MDEVNLPPLSWTTSRRFGTEKELNAFDGRNRPLRKGDLPAGIEEVGYAVNMALDKPVSIREWEHTHNNEAWVVKPDSSCGMEVCSPILKGRVGIDQIVKCAQVFRDHPNITSDGRCSLHVHVNVHDCTMTQVASIVAHWIKCEPVFMDSVPPNRKRSRYCQIIGMCDMFDIDEPLDAGDIIMNMGKSKYFSLNNYHYAKDKRATIEFRIAENDACTNPVFVKNWTRLVVHFCEMVKSRPIPRTYKPGDAWSSLCWLDPIDVFDLMGFLPGKYKLSRGLEQVRDWFTARLMSNMLNTGLEGVFSDLGRSYAWQELQLLAQETKFDGNLGRHLFGKGEDQERWLYSKEMAT